MKSVIKSVGTSMVSRKVALASLTAIVVVAVGLFFIFRSGSKAGSLATALPEDAIAVGKVAFENLYQEDNMLADIIKMYVTDDMIKETGVDVETPAYVFAQQNKGGCVFSLRDEAGFWNYIKVDAESQRGLKWGDYQGQFLIASDGERAMVVGPATSSEQETLRNDVCKWMKQSKCQVAGDIMKAVDKGDGFFTVAASFDKLPSEYTREFTKQGVDLSGLGFFADLAVTRKEIALVMGSIGTNEYFEKMMALNASNKRIDGSLAGMYGDRPFVQGEGGFNGEKFLKGLQTVSEQIPQFRQAWDMVNSMVNVEEIIKAMDGECGIVVPEFSLRQVPDVLVMAQVKDDKFMNNVETWNKVLEDQGTRLQLVPFRDKVYEVKGVTIPCYFGVQDKHMVVTTNAEMLKAKPKGVNAVPEEARKSMGYVCVDLEPTGVWDLLWKNYPLLNLAPAKVSEIKNFNRLLIVAEDNTRVRISLGTWE